MKMQIKRWSVRVGRLGIFPSTAVAPKFKIVRIDKVRLAFLGPIQVFWFPVRQQY